MEKQTCTECGQKFGIGEWLCPTGERHQLEKKRYYMDDAPTDPGPYTSAGPEGRALHYGLRDSQTTIANLTPEKRSTDAAGNQQFHPGRNVVFHRGIYETADAEEQYYLDRREKNGGCCTEERWRQVYLSDTQRLEIDKMQLAADRQRLENDKNELLAKVKQSKEPAGARA